MAPVYDSLAGLMFGKTLYEASVHFLAEIPAGSSVLVLGGGTGKILSKLNKYEVVFVEKSFKMLKKAQQRKETKHVVFVHADFLEWQSHQQFDAVICPFFLDVFSEDNLNLILGKIRLLLTSKGQLMITDFYLSGLRSHRILLKIMHVFFRIFSSLESKKLKPIRKHVLQSGYQISEEKTWREGFIFSLKAAILPR